MDECRPILNTGLRGFTVATTKISDVDGKAGKLLYRGYLAKDLAHGTSFEEVIFLLLYERLPDKKELADIKALIANEMRVPQVVLQALELSPKNALPMDILQAGVAMLAQHDPDVTEYSREAALRMGLRLIAKMPTIVTAWNRIREGKSPVAPDPELGHAANFLYMLTNEKPDDDITAFFNAGLVLHAEHSFNASTFSARQVASTRAHMYSAITAGIGSLSGELHGGANTRVMQMLMEIDSTDKVDGYVNNILKTGGKIMGLGHAVYQTDDPRAYILAPMSKQMGERTGNPKWYELSELLEQKGKEAFKREKGKEIYVNVDFYSASLYYYMGIPIDLFTPVFAVSRIAGWTAHVIEEQFGGAAPKPVLYRPDAEYVGDYCGPDECSFVPLDDR
ncbi:MAG: citrate (Si)-synthase [Deltaproteobacteria bacterium]|nr:citrate (Si)-synthase [Deltaproteobacteria bacterium]